MPVNAVPRPVVGIRCGMCGFENSEGVRYCGSCGTPLHADAGRKCPRCGAAMPEGFRACQMCGFSMDWNVSKRSPGPPTLHPLGPTAPRDLSEPVKWLSIVLMVWGAFDIYYAIRNLVTAFDRGFFTDWLYIDIPAGFVAGALFLFLGVKAWGWSHRR